MTSYQSDQSKTLPATGVIVIEGKPNDPVTFVQGGGNLVRLRGRRLVIKGPFVVEDGVTVEFDYSEIAADNLVMAQSAAAQFASDQKRPDYPSIKIDSKGGLAPNLIRDTRTGKVVQNPLASSGDANDWAKS